MVSAEGPRVSISGGPPTRLVVGCWVSVDGRLAGWLAYAVYWGVRVGYIGELAGWVDGWMGGPDEVVVRDCGLLEDG